MNLKILIEEAEEFLQLLNRATDLSNELEETLNCLHSLNHTNDSLTQGVEYLDTSEGSFTNDTLTSLTLKIQTVLERLS